ncbi:hypothetical protein Syun_002964 [Stephania yunnanensis]|uniref:Uncharacterized protein n=1 Tax=Stephania yunnanensis TaxID=152371 RepID=A0AAP0L203_9MAGN
MKCCPCLLESLEVNLQSDCLKDQEFPSYLERLEGNLQSDCLKDEDISCYWKSGLRKGLQNQLVSYWKDQHSRGWSITNQAFSLVFDCRTSLRSLIVVDILRILGPQISCKKRQRTRTS